MANLDLMFETPYEESNGTLFKRILVLENDLAVADQIRDTLDLHFYEVTVVRTGTEAIRKLLEEEFDAIICDFTMPQFPAEMFHQGVKRIRAELARKFIAITNSGPSSKTARQLGTINIWKPIEPQILLEAVESVLKKAEKTGVRQPNSQAA
jgi:DNA-binding response OmpR family regulator